MGRHKRRRNKFQFTPPHKGLPEKVEGRKKHGKVSIHAPA